VGDTLHIVLRPGYRWSTPTSSTTAVEVVDVERQASGQLDGDLIAVRAGQATVTATGPVLCPPEGACPQLVLLWKLHVTVGA